MSASFEIAVATARSAIERDNRIVKEECREAYIITRQESHYADGSGAYRVFQESAWSPQNDSLLPWSTPTGERVARVNLDGVVENI